MQQETAPRSQKLEVLRKYFGHTSFRPGQERLIDAILAGQDALGIMPTGGGKSMCYQVPGLLLDGVTVVISPLISLMKDQVAALCGAGVAAAYINSSLSAAQQRTVCARLAEGRYKIIYVAPERLELEGFANLLRSMPIALLAVDEAHCISQWGQDFRPSYLRIADFVASLPARPVLAAYTATATRIVREDIVLLLGLRDPITEITGFDRPNLYFDVRRPAKKPDAVVALVQQRAGKSGIIYCATRNGVEKVCALLLEHGILATRYHAGLSAEERQRNQDDFRFDRKPVMVATNAFGMGIDKSNVSYVIHYNMPKSIEAYYQEAGRAGRDGEPADCILLFSQGDVTTARFLIDNGGNDDLTPEQQRAVRRQDYERLDAMVSYCKTQDCLRGALLTYFGQPHPATCGNCGNCRGDYKEVDLTLHAQMILSCVKRIHDQLGYYVGTAAVIETLRGARSQKLLDFGLDELSTYGLMRTVRQTTLRAEIEALTSAGYLTLAPRHATLQPGEKANGVLYHGEKALVRMRAEPTVRIQRLPGAGGPATTAEDLLAALKSKRFDLAKAQHVPAYLVFSNATLADMAAKQPATLEEFLQVSGVGERKAAQYGEAFLDVIAAWKESK